jgi:hypothetical protein
MALKDFGHDTVLTLLVRMSDAESPLDTKTSPDKGWLWMYKHLFFQRQHAFKDDSRRIAYRMQDNDRWEQVERSNQIPASDLINGRLFFETPSMAVDGGDDGWMQSSPSPVVEYGGTPLWSIQRFTLLKQLSAPLFGLSTPKQPKSLITSLLEQQPGPSSAALVSPFQSRDASTLYSDAQIVSPVVDSFRFNNAFYSTADTAMEVLSTSAPVPSTDGVHARFTPRLSTSVPASTPLVHPSGFGTSSTLGSPTRRIRIRTVS